MGGDRTGTPLVFVTHTGPSRVHSRSAPGPAPPLRSGPARPRPAKPPGPLPAGPGRIGSGAPGPRARGPRWLIIEQAQSTLPMAFLAMLIFWLTVLFASLGLLARAT